MARYSDIDKIKIKVMRYLMPNVDFDGTVGVEDAERYFLKLLDEAPTADVVPVVRCKDCEHGQFMPSCSMYLCRCTGGKLRYADNYCNYGERKEQE